MATNATIVETPKPQTITVSYEHPLHCAPGALAECGRALRHDHQRPAHLPRLPQLRPENPAAEFLDPAAGHHAGRLAGGRHSVALHLHVDLRRQRPDVLVYQIVSGHWRQVLFMPRDIPGVWPMVRHYFLFGKKPPVVAAYNPLQKLAYTSTVFFGVVSSLSGLVMYKPVQFWWLTWMLGGFRLARVWHFMAMCGFVAFIPGHLIMVALHGWNNFYSMITGWKRDPEYLE